MGFIFGAILVNDPEPPYDGLVHNKCSIRSRAQTHPITRVERKNCIKFSVNILFSLEFFERFVSLMAVIVSKMWCHQSRWMTKNKTWKNKRLLTQFHQVIHDTLNTLMLIHTKMPRQKNHLLLKLKRHSSVKLNCQHCHLKQWQQRKNSINMPETNPKSRIKIERQKQNKPKNKAAKSPKFDYKFMWKKCQPDFWHLWCV